MVFKDFNNGSALNHPEEVELNAKSKNKKGSMICTIS